MKKAASIFASKDEKRAFNAIRAFLPAGWAVFPNLPLSQVIKFSKDEVTPADWDFYLKTSVDFVITRPSGEPSLIVEFDGLGGGFSFGDTYLPARKTSDSHRTLKMNFKLDICRRAGIPLVVLSVDELNVVSADESTRLLHGIIAQHLVRQDLDTKIKHWDKNERGEGKSFKDMLWDITEAETELQHRYDPVRRELEPLWQRFQQLNAEWSLQPESRPPLEQAAQDRVPLEAVGCKFAARGGALSTPVTVTVWVRNFAGAAFGYILSADALVEGNINPLRIAENAAWYLGIKRVVINNPIAAARGNEGEPV